MLSDFVYARKRHSSVVDDACRDVTAACVPVSGLAIRCMKKRVVVRFPAIVNPSPKTEVLGWSVYSSVSAKPLLLCVKGFGCLVAVVVTPVTTIQEFLAPWVCGFLSVSCVRSIALFAQKDLATSSPFRMKRECCCRVCCSA